VAVVEALAAELRLADWRLEAVGDALGFHPTRAAAVIVDGQRAGVVGEVAEHARRALDLAVPVVVGELDVAVLAGGRRRQRRASLISRFPASSIDLAFVVADTVPAGAVRETLRAAAGAMGEQVELFDIFRAESLGPGRVSLAFTCSFRAPDRTLTDAEVATLRQAAIDAVVAAHGAELRA
jgi:phenylalanyl-tRNA synthetase beta chain